MNAFSSRILHLAMAGIAALTLLALAGCGGHPVHYTAHDITGLLPNLNFELTDENGQPVDAGKYADARLNILYFGYTYCPDVCPMTLARISTALAGLAPDVRDKVNVLFVSVDPKRDTPKRLKTYTAHFGPRFVGLTGTQDQLRKFTKAMRITYSYGKPGQNGFYLVSHSAGVFVFDDEGQVRLLIGQDETADQITADLQTLLKQTA